MEQQRLAITPIPAGPIETNAYVVVDEASKQAMIVDAPPDVLEQLRAALGNQGATATMLVLTHTHWDHIGDAAAIASELGVPVLVHELEAGHLAKPSAGPIPIAGVEADTRLADGDVVRVGEIEFVVMHTPGHSPGQISLYSAADGLMIGGDTLFPNGYGRVDIPGASKTATVATITRLLELPDDVTVLTGHGAPTTIGSERVWMERVAATGQLFE